VNCSTVGTKEIQPLPRAVAANGAHLLAKCGVGSSGWLGTQAVLRFAYLLNESRGVAVGTEKTDDRLRERVQAAHQTGSAKARRIGNGSKRRQQPQRRGTYSRQLRISPSWYRDHRRAKLLHLTSHSEKEIKVSLRREDLIWVDAPDFAVSHISARPAKNLSFWISSVEVEHRYAKHGDMWLPETNRSRLEDSLWWGGRTRHRLSELPTCPGRRHSSLRLASLSRPSTASIHEGRTCCGSRSKEKWRFTSVICQSVRIRPVAARVRRLRHC
jgi:hypothetical protein